MRSMELSTFLRAVILGSVCLTLTHPRMWSQAASGLSVHVEDGDMMVKPGGDIQLNCIGSSKNLVDYITHRLTWTVEFLEGTVRNISQGFFLDGASKVLNKYNIAYGQGQGGMYFKITVKDLKYHDSGVYTCSLYGDDAEPISSSNLALTVVRPIAGVALLLYDRQGTVAVKESSGEDVSTVDVLSKRYGVKCLASRSNVKARMLLRYNEEEIDATPFHEAQFSDDGLVYYSVLLNDGFKLQAMDAEQTLTCEVSYPGDVYLATKLELKLRTKVPTVDGGWAMWSALSECDVTCGSGHMTRTRTCTDPAPAHGGLDCVGEATQIQRCKQKKCPVDGVWTDWGAWSGCSETCDLGLLVRQRSCSNPKPKWGGEPCDGFPVDYKHCVVQGCRDGHWSDWEPWTSCTGSSIRSRTRQCDNPAPSWYGRPCAGQGLEYTDCPRQAVAFSVLRTDGTLVNNLPVLLEYKVITNVGESYNEVTGEFTCPVPGLYFFSVTLWVYAPNQYVKCSLCKNGAEIPFFVQGGSYDDNDSRAVQIYLQLSVDDTIGICACWENGDAYIGSYFSGGLISPA